jgi:hypothetical protein
VLNFEEELNSYGLDLRKKLIAIGQPRRRAQPSWAKPQGRATIMSLT